MTPQEARWLQHAVGGDPIIGTYLRNQAMYGNDAMKTAMNQPVCPKCERFAFYHQQGIACPSCGYRGAAGHKLKIHLREGHYK